MLKLKNYFSIFLPVLFFVGIASAQTTEFTYQGRLTDNNLPPTASYDFEFRLFSVDTGGAAIATQQRSGVSVANGIFTVRLDYGANFGGAPRWLEIAVKSAGGSAFTILSPRQPISSAPYSVRSLNAITADNSNQLGGVTANQFVQTSDARLSDNRNPTAGSQNYIQNTATQQAASNFNVSGSGTLGGTISANAVTSATQFNIGANRVLAASSSAKNTFAGVGAGTSSGAFAFENSFFGFGAGEANNSGLNNSFFGNESGKSNTASNNSFFGSESGFGNTNGTRNASFGLAAGRNNPSGNDNAVFGYRAGQDNTASENSFFGSNAGKGNTDGAGNVFFGYNAGAINASGDLNSFFGSGAGIVSTGNNNSFFGYRSGYANTTGAGNTFVGLSAGNVNTTGDFNTIIGWNADVSSSNLQFATAIGAGATVTENNTLVLGRQTDKVKMSVLQITGGSDLAENFEIDGGEAKPGMIVAIDPRRAGKLIVARGAYNRRAAGVISGANNLSAGMILPDLKPGEKSMPIALSGRVWVYADATRQPIKPGDLLTTSATTAGYAMKATNYRRAQGAIIGKAMTDLKSGKGLVLVLVSLQ